MFSHTAYTLSHQLARAAYEFHDKPAIIHYKNYYRRQFYFHDLQRLSRQTACYLEQRGLQKADKIAIWASNCPEWVVLLGACALMGVIVVPIDIMASDSFVRSILSKVSPKYLFCDRQNFQFDIAQETLDGLFNKVAIFGTQPKKSYVVTGSDPFQIIFTSGTTSEPKGVVLRHQNLLANIQSLQERVVYPEQSRFLSILPLSHMMEQTIGLLGPMLFGSCIIYTTGRPLPHMLKIAKREKVTHMVVVPGILELMRLRLEKQIEKSSYLEQCILNFAGQLPQPLRNCLLKPVRRNLRAFICGGAALKPQTHSFFESLGIAVLCGYGMTEASPVISCQSMSDHLPGQVGMVLPRQFLRIADDGQILTSGDNITTGYFENEKATEEAFTSDGWLKTGDLGRLDEYGRLTIFGRSKEMILTSNGLNVFPQDIESILDSQPQIIQSVVVEDPLREGSLLAVVRVQKDTSKEAIEQIRTQVNQNLAVHQQIARIQIWEGEFPKTHTLKIKRNQVQKAFSHSNRGEQVICQLPKAAQIIAEMAQRPANESLLKLRLEYDLNFDSMQIVELWMRLQSQLGQEIPSAVFEQDPDIATLCQRLDDLKDKPNEGYLGASCHNVVNRFLRRLVQPIALKFFKTMWPIDIKGVCPIPAKSSRPIMIIANHTSHFDLVAILSALSPTVCHNVTVAAARDHFFKSPLAIQARILNSFVATIGFCRKGDHESNLRLLEKVWDSEHPLILFPEGTRSRNGELLPFKRGGAWLAKEFHAIIFPVFLKGCYERWSADQRWPSKQDGCIELKWLKPIDSEDFKTCEQLNEAMQDSLLQALNEPLKKS